MPKHAHTPVARKQDFVYLQRERGELVCNINDYSRDESDHARALPVRDHADGRYIWSNGNKLPLENCLTLLHLTEFK